MSQSEYVDTIKVSDKRASILQRHNQDIEKVGIKIETNLSTDKIDDSKKMSKLQAFTALSKGYCSINILVLPK